jgi:hypothetical protein
LDRINQPDPEARGAVSLTSFVGRSNYYTLENPRESGEVINNRAIITKLKSQKAVIGRPTRGQHFEMLSKTFKVTRAARFRALERQRHTEIRAGE